MLLNINFYLIFLHNSFFYFSKYVVCNEGACTKRCRLSDQSETKKGRGKRNTVVCLSLLLRLYSLAHYFSLNCIWVYLFVSVWVFSSVATGEEKKKHGFGRYEKKWKRVSRVKWIEKRERKGLKWKYLVWEVLKKSYIFSD